MFAITATVGPIRSCPVKRDSTIPAARVNNAAVTTVRMSPAKNFTAMNASSTITASNTMLVRLIVCLCRPFYITVSIQNVFKPLFWG